MGNSLGREWYLEEEGRCERERVGSERARDTHVARSSRHVSTFAPSPPMEKTLVGMSHVGTTSAAGCFLPSPKNPADDAAAAGAAASGAGAAAGGSGAPGSCCTPRRLSRARAATCVS